MNLYFYCLPPIYANSCAFLSQSYNSVHNLYISNNIFTVWSKTLFGNFHFFCCRSFHVLLFHHLFEIFLIWLLTFQLNQSQHASWACTTEDILEWWNAEYYSLFFTDKAEFMFAFWNVQSLRWTGAFNKIK